MTQYNIDIEDVVSDFLRTNVSDPSTRLSTNSNNLIATASQTDFDITATTSKSVSCITSVTVDGTAQTKWTDYFWDYQNSKIIFYTGLTVGQAVVVNFKEGSTDWIFSDKPNDRVKAVAFPRISLFTVGGGGNKIGNYQAKIDSRPVIQIDIWTRINQVSTVGTKKYSNEYLGRYIGNRIIDAFNDNEDQLFGVFFDYDVVGFPRAAPFSEEFQAYHTIVEIRVKGLDLGRIVK